MAAQATADRIVDAVVEQFHAKWFDEIRLDDVAREAGVTIQTLIRRFGGKEGLLGAMHERLDKTTRARRDVAPGDAAAIVDALIENYEEVGALFIRMLAQEDRYAAIKALTDIGRGEHRAWMANAFAPWLAGLSPDDRRRTIDTLVVAGDVYVWKLVRNDMKRPVAVYRAIMESLCAAAFGLAPEKMFRRSGTRGKT